MCCSATISALRARPAPEFAAYIHERNYDLCSAQEYREHLAQAGFAVLRAEDRTDDFIATLERELEHLPASQLPAHEREELADSWRASCSAPAQASSAGACS